VRSLVCFKNKGRVNCSESLLLFLSLSSRATEDTPSAHQPNLSTWMRPVVDEWCPGGDTVPWWPRILGCGATSQPIAAGQYVLTRQVCGKTAWRFVMLSSNPCCSIPLRLSYKLNRYEKRPSFPAYSRVVPDSSHRMPELMLWVLRTVPGSPLRVMSLACNAMPESGSRSLGGAGSSSSRAPRPHLHVSTGNKPGTREDES
jgi:hypothetical protein